MKRHFKVVEATPDYTDNVGMVYVADPNSPKFFAENSTTYFGSVSWDLLNISGDMFFYPSSTGRDEGLYLQCLNPDEVKAPENDLVKQPKHYEIFRGIEAKDIMEVVASSHLCQDLSAWEIHCFLTMLKYRLRAGSKDDLEQDIAKADEYKNCLR